MATEQQETSSRMMTDDRRLIEETLPLRAISQESLRDKAIRHGHISTLHPWWARRPLPACRAIVFGSLTKDKCAGQDRARLNSFVASLCTWEASNNQNLLDEARRLILEDNGSVRPKLLDCFAGGGAIPLEALRVGCETYASELNPVAVLLLLSTLVYPMRYGKTATIESKQTSLMASGKKSVSNELVHDFNHWAFWVLTAVRNEIGIYYRDPGPGLTALAYLWARTLKCPNPKCGTIVPLLSHLWLAKRRKIALRMVTDARSKRVSFQIAEGKTSGLDPGKGTIRLGTMQCPVCKEGTLNKFDIKSTARESGFGLQPLAIVVRGRNGNRAYRTFSGPDLEAFSQATTRLRELESSWSEKLSLIPNEPISRDFDWVLKPPMFGLTTWGDIFNDRQKLALATFLIKIKDAYKKMLHDGYDSEYAKAIATYLALCLDRLADYNSTSCYWHTSGEKISPTFVRQAIAMAWGYAEVNPFSEATGDWKSAVEWISGVIEHCSALYPHIATIQQATATKLPYPDSHFDAVITDPPYYDAVPYSDLSDFFYVWLKRAIGDLYPNLFVTPLAPKSEEIVEQSDRVASASRRHKDKDFYEGVMTKAFQEAHRVLRQNGICVIAFAHKSTSAWEKLISAILSAGFRVTASWPIHTEMKARLRAHSSAALASSVWLVCRKRDPAAAVGSWKSVQEDLGSRVKERLDYFLAQGIKGADALLSAIGPALEVFGQYDRVEKVTGEQVTIAEFLDKVREVVAHHALSTVLSEQELGSVDAPTAFYVLWKWTFESISQNKPINSETKAKGNGNRLPVPFDEALKLARSVGADPEVLLKAHLLKQDKEYVELLDSNDRKHVTGLGETARDGTSPSTIDAIHRALNLWAAMEKAKLEEYLDKSGAMNNEIFWQVAQALSNLLPIQSREKQLLDGLLARHSGGGEARPRDLRSLDEFVGKKEK